ncbi:MAG: response regulator with CheY-like receiver domain and winged-helix DNA-binding domain [Bacteroidetes bacterium]|nr:response regulator with CheY-like receiver domain and winged-helix DNA-binding domain [Bacteroidota bacterium]
MKILVVDDEEAHRLLLRNHIQSEEWDVLTAEDGEDALARLAKEKIDIIVSDVYMPVMDGIRLHKTVRSIPGYEKIPFLFVSAYDDQYTMEAVKDPKIDGFMKKGKPMAELKEWIRYLTAPEDQRPKFPPGQTRKAGPHDQFRKKPGDSWR